MGACRKSAFFLQETPTPTKFLVLEGGGILGFCGRGGSADSIFMGAGIFLIRAVETESSSKPRKIEEIINLIQTRLRRRKEIHKRLRSDF